MEKIEVFYSDVEKFKKWLFENIKSDKNQTDFLDESSKLSIKYHSNLKKEYEEYLKKNKTCFFAHDKEQELIEKLNHANKEIESVNNVKFVSSLHYRSSDKRYADDDYQHGIFVGDKLVYSYICEGSTFDHIKLVEYYLQKIKSDEKFLANEINEKLDEIKLLKENSSLFNKFRISKLTKQLAASEKSVKVLRQRDVQITKLYNDFNTMLINGRTVKGIQHDIQLIKNSKHYPIYNKPTAISDKLNRATRDIIELNLAKLYSKNYQVLHENPNGANQTLMQFIGKIEDNIDYHIKNTLSNKLDETLLIYNLANKMHENYRQNFKEANGTYKPNWKTVSDEKYIENIEAKYTNSNLPKNLRYNTSHKLEIDIANSSFNNLSFDWQMKNFAAAKILKTQTTAKITKELASNSVNVKNLVSENIWLNGISNDKQVGTDLDIPFVDQILSVNTQLIALEEITKQNSSLQNPTSK